MKLSCLVFVIGFTGFQLMASSGKGQDANVQVVLELKDGSLKNAFTEIEKQTDFRFAYSRADIEPYKNITIQKATYSLQKAMELLLEKTQLSFRLLNNKVIIFKSDEVQAVNNDAGLNEYSYAKADGTIKGRITNDKAEPVVGASVIVAGINKGIAAGTAGEFTITGVKPGKYKLQVSAIGYQNMEREITVGDNETLELALQLITATVALNDVVVTGYSRQSKRDVTGAVSTISADVVSKTPVTDIGSVLQGRVAMVLLLSPQKPVKTVHLN